MGVPLMDEDFVPLLTRKGYGACANGRLGCYPSRRCAPCRKEAGHIDDECTRAEVAASSRDRKRAQREREREQPDEPRNKRTRESATLRKQAERARNRQD